MVLKSIDEINDQIRLFRLEVPKDGPPIRVCPWLAFKVQSTKRKSQFLPGQWLDVFTPGIARAGGFTITSPPSKARSSDAETPPGHFELAVQKSPDNPPAAWLWQEEAVILNSELHVRVGGSFVWPPPGINVHTLRRVVFVAGGVGINPLVSMLSSLAEKSGWPFEVTFLYSIKDPGGEREAERILFLERLANIFAREKVKGELKLFLTGGSDKEGVVSCNEVDVPFAGRRLTVKDIEQALGSPSDRRFAAVYVCGVPTMTDGLVSQLTGKDGLGMEPHRVLQEKWW